MRSNASIEQMYLVVKEACLTGINHLETAPAYGTAESLLGTPIKKFEISDTQFGLYQGGKVGVKDGSQEKIKNYLKRV